MAQDDATRGAQDERRLRRRAACTTTKRSPDPHAGRTQVSAADSTTPRKLGAVSLLPREMPWNVRPEARGPSPSRALDDGRSLGPENTAITCDTETQDNRRPHLSQHGLSTGPPLLHSGNPSVRQVHCIVLRHGAQRVRTRRGRPFTVKAASVAVRHACLFSDDSACVCRREASAQPRRA